MSNIRPDYGEKKLILNQLWVVLKFGTVSE